MIIQHQTMHQKVTGKVAYTAKETIRFCSAETYNTFTVEPDLAFGVQSLAFFEYRICFERTWKPPKNEEFSSSWG
ncbi:MAG: hypothetical protein KGZ97_09185 [Bacteroidetes bacterium]|nr:hypothetical protein [Bacteroidota bacterium]